MDSGRCWNGCYPSALLSGSVVRVEDRIAFTAIVFVLVTGLSWRLVPQRSLHLPLLSLGCALIFCRRLQR
jgi:hypothetical protein